ncbi:hypothetical protein J5N97_011257 [Dioscorea zingiberensis]|uniref:Glycosyltransferase n=1 Tax=Dioscorea zingiberensis TaxID=325984 RepID=A0A9D5D206_9LILI|nr:hypothetical protein J5N97_011257 [Dioscorea zingiberensis]
MAKKGLVLLPIPAAGHLKAMVETALKLLHHHSDVLSVTVLLMNSIPGVSLAPNHHTYIHSITSSGFDIHFEELPLIDPPHSDEKDGSPASISLYIQKLLPHINASLSNILSSTPSTTLIVDFFASTVVDEAKKLGISTYVFFTSGAAMLALVLYGPVLFDKKKSMEVFELPGMDEPIPYLSLPTSFTMTNSASFSWFLYHGRRFLETKGMIINTFTALESQVIKALEDGLYVHGSPTPPIYPIGPVISLQNPSNEEKEQHETIKWLDGQDPGSVVFLCFGSMGTFTVSQVKEIAHGVERSGHRFLWSLRMTGLPVPSNALLDEVLPEKFLERTRDRGLVWPATVHQTEILAHRAVGGFVSHCGWNSILESLWFGVPMLSWPLYAEQHFNAYRMVKSHGLAVELRVDRKDGGFVSGEEVENGVRVLMGDSEEVKKVKERCGQMKVESRRAVEEGGSSFVSLQRLAGSF